MTSSHVDTALAAEVRAGLTRSPKRLSSRFFYDDEGSRLFSEIMHTPEYYLTRCEYEIIDTHKEQLLTLFSAADRPFNLIELGAGDGLKTKVLLSHFVANNVDFTYVPIDISGAALTSLVTELAQRFPGLSVRPQPGDYTEALAQLVGQDAPQAAQQSNVPEGVLPRQVVLFLGSNIGNFTAAEATAFYQRISDQLQPGDVVLTGFDLQKHPAVIHAAYNDRQGLTKAFNLNLLRRVNRELEADFNLAAFDHYEMYDPETGEARSYLVSQTKQTVTIRALDLLIPFQWGDVIHTEISRKYTRAGVEQLAAQTGFALTHWLTDCKQYFADVVFEKR